MWLRINGLIGSLLLFQFLMGCIAIPEYYSTGYPQHSAGSLHELGEPVDDAESAVPEADLAESLPPPADCPLLDVKKVVVEIRSGDPVGSTYNHMRSPVQFVCSTVWNSNALRIRPEDFADAARDQCKESGYKVVGDSSDLFGQTADRPAALLLGAVVKRVNVEVRLSGEGVGRVDAFVEAEWSVFSRTTQSVKLKETTRGSIHHGKLTETSVSGAVLMAFRRSTQNLLANLRFQRLALDTSFDKGPVSQPVVAIKTTRPAPATQAIANAVDQARQSVVTLETDTGHGSGFIISEDGYVLTNHHVAGDAIRVKAKTLDGNEVAATVVKSNPRLDVALVKLASGKYRPLTLGSSADAPPGTDVYAIGAPLTAELGQTVTRGVVSGFRVLDGQQLIQSDVAVNPGNSGGPLITKTGEVVGIAMSSVRSGGAGLGINLFIPIEDALVAVGVRSATTQPEK